MCLLTFFSPGVQPDLAALHTGAEFNDDGHGFALVVGRQLVVERGLDGEAVIAAFARARRAHPEGPALFHSRWRTHGRAGLDNCHPFPVGGDQRTVIAHNGILPVEVRPKNLDARSDTRIAAEEFLPAFGPLHLRRTRLALERWMTPNNLMVLLTVDRRFRRRAYLFNEDSGTWAGGIWYSNEGYLPAPPSWRTDPDTSLTTGWGSADRYRDEPMVRCEHCRAVIDPTDPSCPWCEHCWACGDLPDHCTCWPPAALDPHLNRHH